MDHCKHNNIREEGEECNRNKPTKKYLKSRRKRKENQKRIKSFFFFFFFSFSVFVAFWVFFVFFEFFVLVCWAMGFDEDVNETVDSSGDGWSVIVK